MCELEEKICDYLEWKDKEKLWDIRSSSVGGRGLFACRDIEPGEVVFVDKPLVIGPRFREGFEEVCAVCFGLKNLEFCARKCGLKICSEDCLNSKAHREECRFINSRKNSVDLEKDPTISSCLTVIRALFLSDDLKQFFYQLQSHKHPKHNYLVDFMKENLNLNLSQEEEKFLKLVSSVFDANAFEVLVASNEKSSSVRGLYPLGSLANHNCSPNLSHCFDNKQRMITKAAVFIPKNSELFHSYTRLTWGTITRRYHLYHTKHFSCNCSRCRDQTEFETYLSAIKCQKCPGLVLPVNSFELKSTWRCLECREETPLDRVSFIMSILGSNVQNFEKNEDVELILKFLEKIKPLVPDSNQIAVELKYKLIWILGYKPGYYFEDLSDNLLIYKENVCKEILDLIWKLKTGLCKMRGLLLYEVYQCKREKVKRKIENNLQDGESLLKEAANILLYDVSASEEIRKLWVKMF